MKKSKKEEDKLRDLIIEKENHKMTHEEWVEQRINWALGQTRFRHPNMTEEQMRKIMEEADKEWQEKLKENLSLKEKL